MNKKIAWCIITDNENDVISLKRFAERLKWLNSKYPVLALLGDNLDINLLEESDNLTVRTVPRKLIDNSTRYQSTMMKAAALLQEDYDLLCFIETDIILLNNIDFILDENLDEIFNNKNSVVFMNDSYGMEVTNHIQGICFFIKPNKSLYTDLFSFINTCDKSTQIVDEVIWTKFFETYKKINIDSVQLINKNIFVKFCESMLHFPGYFKPWCKYFGEFRNLYYNSSYKEFNTYIDTSETLNRLRMLHGCTNLFYRITNEELNEETFEYAIIHYGLECLGIILALVDINYSDNTEVIECLNSALNLIPTFKKLTIVANQLNLNASAIIEQSEKKSNKLINNISTTETKINNNSQINQNLAYIKAYLNIKE